MTRRGTSGRFLHSELESLPTHVLVAFHLTPSGAREALLRGQLLLEGSLGYAKEAAKLTGVWVRPSLPWVALRLQQPSHQSTAPCISDHVRVDRIIATAQAAEGLLRKLWSLQHHSGDQ